MRELVSALIDASPVSCVPVGELELPAYYDSSQQTIFVKKGLSEEVLFMSMAKEVSAAVYDFKYNESRDVSDFKSFCVAYMVSSRYGVDTRGFDFSRLPTAGSRSGGRLHPAWQCRPECRSGQCGQHLHPAPCRGLR